MKFKNIISCAFLIIAFFSNSFAQDEVYKTATDITGIDTTLRDDRYETMKTTKAVETAAENTVAENKKKFDFSKMRFGGNFGLQFGTYTYINLSPTVGYLFAKDRLLVSTGPIFIYQRFKQNNTTALNFLVYGVSASVRGYVWKGLFLETQYAFVNKPSYYNYPKRIGVNHLLLGGGYSTPVGNVGEFFVTALYNVIDNRESIYQGTFGDFPLILNVGFNFGINKR